MKTEYKKSEEKTRPNNERIECKLQIRIKFMADFESQNKRYANCIIMHTNEHFNSMCMRLNIAKPHNWHTGTLRPIPERVKWSHRIENVPKNTTMNIQHLHD